MKYVSANEASKHYGVCTETLRWWPKEGKIEYFKTKGGHRRYKIIEKPKSSL